MKFLNFFLLQKTNFPLHSIVSRCIEQNTYSFMNSCQISVGFSSAKVMLRHNECRLYESSIIFRCFHSDGRFIKCCSAVAFCWNRQHKIAMNLAVWLIFISENNISVVQSTAAMCTRLGTLCMFSFFNIRRFAM